LIVEPIQGMGDVKELRLVLTVSNFDAAVALYRDALVRVAFRVDDSDKAAKRLAAAGADGTTGTLASVRRKACS
jgi:hypothetical protein